MSNDGRFAAAKAAGMLVTDEQLATEAAYLRIRPMRPGRLVHRTVEVIGDTLMVDLDEDGAVLGIERIGGPVDLDSLGAVIRWLRAPAIEADIAAGGAR